MCQANLSTFQDTLNGAFADTTLREPIRDKMCEEQMEVKIYMLRRVEIKREGRRHIFYI